MSELRRNGGLTRMLRVLGLVVRKPLGLIALIVLVAVTLAVVLAPWISPDNPLTQNLTVTLQGLGTPGHLLGTDQLGRDLLSRLLYGGRPALLGVLVAAATYSVFGLTLGVLAGYLGGWVDTLVGLVVDFLMALPTLVFLLVVLTVFSNNIIVTMAVFGVLASGNLIRIVRGSALAIREELFIAAARTSGLGQFRIAVRHVVPGVFGTYLVQVFMFNSAALGLQTGLAFLGLGVSGSAPSWGGLIANGMTVLSTDPSFFLVTSGAVVIVTLASGLLGDALRDALQDGRTGHGARRDAAAAPVVPPRGPAADPVPDPLLSVRGRRITFTAHHHDNEVVHGIDFEVGRAEIVGLVGESGSGKTVTALSLLGLLPPSARAEGTVVFDGEDLGSCDHKRMAPLRGRRIALVSQEPQVALDPSFTIGTQLREVIRALAGASRREAGERARALLESVALRDPDAVLHSYPHQLSGGMLQRVVIAMALAGDPDLLIADEPTTALDVTVQAGVLDLLRQIRDERHMSILLVTHDLGVVADLCDRVVVMNQGVIVETAPVDDLFGQPADDYTRALIESTPNLLGAR